MVKINSLGMKEWDATFGGDSTNYLRDVQQAHDGSYIVGGTTTSGLFADKSEPSRGHWDYWIVKTLTPISLPAYVFNFSGRKVNNSAELHWETNDNRYNFFNIQRSNNANHFITIGTITAQSGNHVQSHKATDKDAFNFSSIVYYRLQMIGKDGSITYSNVLPLQQLILTTEMQVYPNPVSSLLTLSIENHKNEAARLIITNSNGIIVRQDQIRLITGTTIWKHNLTQLPAGTYFLILQTKESITKKQIIKR
jgi:hypothetical protein